MVLIVGGAFQGKAAYARAHFPGEYRILDRYHETVRRQLEEGKNPVEEAERLWAQADAENLVIICDEVGCGLVPVDAFERNWREQVGRTCCYLASRAEQVVRVVCGIGTKLKG